MVICAVKRDLLIWKVTGGDSVSPGDLVGSRTYLLAWRLPTGFIRPRPSVISLPVWILRNFGLEASGSEILSGCRHISSAAMMKVSGIWSIISLRNNGSGSASSSGPASCCRPGTQE
ncbi:hypothetical protein AVEN_259469-1 [Araneus ventricosus]|uniref:Uncharacterized protein n=1 Tax=Araneus ventricosus TaxID=182803 RepID=A0A4Y2I273_ARAVE|nr:hypothetical protein AVEN_259469-1 [Araneus ventricosus]